MIYYYFRKRNILIYAFLLSTTFGCVEISQENRASPPEKVSYSEISLIEETDDKGFVIKLSWSPPENRGNIRTGDVASISSYEIEISTSPDFADTVIFYTSDKTMLEIRDLEASGEVYYIRIYVKNSANLLGEPSRVFKKIIGKPSLASPSEPPSEITIVDESLKSTSIKFKWNEPKNKGNKRDGSPAKIKSYIMQYSPVKTFIPKVEIETIDLEGDLKNLSSDALYYFRILAKNDNEDSEKELSTFSEAILFRTLAKSSTAPDPPSKVILEKESPTSDSALILWGEPLNKGTIDGIKSASIVKYEVQYSLKKDFSTDRWTVYTEGSETEKQIENLIPGNTYFVRVRVINNNEDKNKKISEYAVLSESFEVKTSENVGESSPPEEVNSINFTDIKDSEVMITWNQVNEFGKKTDGSDALILNYTLEYADNSFFDNKKSVTFGFKATLKKRLLNLKVSTKYYVRVKTKNNNDVIGFNESTSQILTFNTLSPTPPKEPSNFTAQLADGNLGKTQVDLLWSFNQDTDSGLRGNLVDKANVEEFEVEYSTDNFVNDIQRVDPNPSVEIVGFSVSNLKSNMLYRFRIRAVNDNNVSDPNKRTEAVSKFVISQEVVTLSGESPPLSPPSLTIILADGIEGRTKVLASWQAPENFGTKPDGTNGEARKYILEYVDADIFPVNDSSSLIIKKSTLYKDDLDLSVTNLKPNTTYAFRLRAVNTNEGVYKESSISDPSITKIIKTKNLSESPAKPIINKSNDYPMGGKAYNSIKATWNQVFNVGKKADGRMQGLKIQGYISRIYPKFIDVSMTETQPNNINNPFTSVSESRIFEKIGLTEETIYILEVITVSNHPDDEYKNSEVAQLEFTTTRTPRYQVVFNTTQGGSAVNSQEVAENQNAMEPESEPQKENYTFDGWYKENSYTNRFNFDTEVIISDTEIFAKFISN